MSMIISKKDVKTIYDLLQKVAKTRYQHQYLNGVITFKNIMIYPTFESFFNIDESQLINQDAISIEIEDFANNPDFSMLSMPEAYDEELSISQHWGGTYIDWQDNIIVNKILTDVRDFIDDYIKNELIKQFHGGNLVVVVPQLEIKRNFPSNLESVTIFLDVEVNIPL